MTSLTWTTISGWHYAAGTNHTFRIETRAAKAPPGYMFRAEVFRKNYSGNPQAFAYRTSLAAARQWCAAIEDAARTTHAMPRAAARR